MTLMRCVARIESSFLAAKGGIMVGKDVPHGTIGSVGRIGTMHTIVPIIHQTGSKVNTQEN